MLKELVNPIDRDMFRDEFLKSEPFPYFCIDNFLNESFANEVSASFPSYQKAQELGREFSAVNERKKIQISNASKFPTAIKKLNQLFSSKEYMDMWSDLTGVPNLLSDDQLIGGGIHETNAGGHLDVHIDFNYNDEMKAYRRLNILVYFNKDWKEEYGGYLDIWDQDVKKCYGSFAPLFNRACGFLTSETSFHGVTPLTCPSSVIRKSFATYLYTKKMPLGWSGKKHSTVFRARPNEWLKGNILMPYQKTIEAVRKGQGELKSGLKRLILK